MKTLRVKKNGSRKILMSFSVSYMVMLLIPLIMCVVACSFYITTIETAVREGNNQRVSSALFQLEQSLNEADNHQKSLVSRNGGLNKLMRSDSVNTYDVRQLIGNIGSFQDGFGLFSRYYIYSRENMVLLEPSRGYISYFRDYATSFAYGDYTAQEWLGMLNSRQSGLLPVATVANPEGPSRALPYVANYPLNNINCGKIVYYLDAERLLTMLEGILDQEYPCRIWLTTGDGTLLFSNTDAALPAGSLSASEVSIDGDNYYISRLSSAKHHFILHTAIREDSFKASTIHSLSPMMAVMALMLVLGIIFSVYLWQLNHRPLRETLEHLSLPDGSESRGLWQIHDAVNDLTQANNTLLEIQGVQQDLLRTAAINRMLSGDLHTSHELDGLLQFIDLDIDCDCYRGIFLMLGQPKEDDESGLWQLEQQKTLLSEALAPCGEKLRLLSVHDMNSFALLYSTKQKETGEQGMIGTLSGVFHLLSQRGMQNVCFYVGVPCRDFCSLSRSFHSAKELMDSNRDSLENDWLMIADEEDSQKGYHLSEQQERHLVNFARAGNKEGVARLLQEIYQENASHAATTAFSRRLLMARIVDLLLEAGYTGELEQEILWQLFSMHFSRFFELIGPHFEALCNSVRQNQANRESMLAQNIVKTLQDEFSNQDMSLTLLSLRFGIAEKRLSTMIRESTGLSFQGYLEKLRIDHANVLLEQGEMTVDKIACATGYVNDRTFRRAYIRVMGYAPSRHRQLLMGGDENSMDALDKEE